MTASVKEGWATPKDGPFHEDVRAGFVYERVPHITLKAIANNTRDRHAVEDLYQPAVETARAALNAALAGHPMQPFEVTTGGRSGPADRLRRHRRGRDALRARPAPASGFTEWEIPREMRRTTGRRPAKAALDDFWKARIARQRAIDAAIERKGREDDYEVLYDKPFEDKKRVRVAGPFTVESLSPHRAAAVDEHGELIDEIDAGQGQRLPEEQEAENYRKAIMENLLEGRGAPDWQGRRDPVRQPRSMAGRVDRRRGPLSGR